MIGLAVTVAWCLFTATGAQPFQLICKSDDQCLSGSYCAQDALVCLECLDCGHLKRNAPSVPSSCIKSIGDCGTCMKGLVEDLRGELHACVEPTSEETSYIGWLIGGLVALCLAVISVFVYLLCSRGDYSNILASTSTSVLSPCTTVPSAPDLPPPYSKQFSSVRPTSPGPEDPLTPNYEHHNEPQQTEENSLPIKRAPSTRLSEVRKSDASQAAFVYNFPNYVRASQVPSSMVVDDEPAQETLTVHDEDTMESTWTPDNERSDVNGNSSRFGAIAAEAAAGEGGSGAPPAAADARALCLTQDTNNNRNNTDPVSNDNNPQTAGPSVYINNYVNITAFQQQNNCSL